MGIEYGLGQGACLEQGKAKKHRVAHTGPDCRGDIRLDCDVLHKNRVNCHADNDQEGLKSQGQQGAQVVLEKIPEELADKLPLDRVEILQENDPVSVTKPQMQDPEIRTIPVPVVFVLGTGPHTNKLEVQTALGKHFRERGYAVSQVASRNLGNFLGYHTVPESLFSQAATTKDRIILLNRYFHKIYLRDKPEVMVIGLPGGIMPVNPIRFDELGEKAYLISQAVTPDAAVLCTYAFEFNQEYVKEMQAICQYRLGTAVKHLVVSGTEIGLSPETSQTEHSMVPGSLIREKCSFSFSGVSCHYALDPQDLECLGASVLRE